MVRNDSKAISEVSFELGRYEIRIMINTPTIEGIFTPFDIKKIEMIVKFG